MANFQLPIFDNALKTKKDVQDAVIQICEPLKKFYSEGGAELHIGNTGAAYNEAIARMEGFSRPLWGLVPLTAGGKDYDLWEVYLKGIKNGTNPEHKEYWGKIKDGDQRMVEMAAISLAIILTPEKIWEPLNESEKNNLVAWLEQINHFMVHDCNWKYFNIMVNIALKAVSEGDNSYKVRYKCEEFKIQENVLYSRWKPMKDVEIETWLLPGIPWHVRIHKINTLRFLETAEGGFAIKRESDLVVPENDRIIAKDNCIVAKFKWGTSGIINLLGDRNSEMISAEPNTNLLYPRTIIPTLIGNLEPGIHWNVCAVLGDEEDCSNNGLWENPPSLIKNQENIVVKHGDGREMFKLEIKK